MVLPELQLDGLGRNDGQSQGRRALLRPLERRLSRADRIPAGPMAARGDQFPRRAARTPEIALV